MKITSLMGWRVLRWNCDDDNDYDGDDDHDGDGDADADADGDGDADGDADAESTGGRSLHKCKDLRSSCQQLSLPYCLSQVVKSLLIKMMMMTMMRITVSLIIIIIRFCVFDHCQSFGGVTVLHALATLRCCYFTGLIIMRFMSLMIATL